VRRQAFAGIVTVSVGHCHPRVVAAIDAQNHRLQHTTTIYLNHQIAQYAQELTARLPGDLKARARSGAALPRFARACPQRGPYADACLALGGGRQQLGSWRRKAAALSWFVTSGSVPRRPALDGARGVALRAQRRRASGVHGA